MKDFLQKVLMRVEDLNFRNQDIIKIGEYLNLEGSADQIKRSVIKLGLRQIAKEAGIPIAYLGDFNKTTDWLRENGYRTEISFQSAYSKLIKKKDN